MLAVLSVRFTDQPQRWAAAPALFMGLGGLRPGGVRLLVHARCSTGCGRRPCWRWRSGWSSAPVDSCVAERALAALPGARGVGGGLNRRRLRDRAGSARRQGLPAARPADRRRRPPAAPALHRLGQPHRRPRAGCGDMSSTSAGSRRPWPATPGSASTTAPVADGASPPATPQDGAQIATDLHTLLHRGTRARALRAGGSLLRRPLRAHLRRPLPRRGRRHGAARLHRTQARPRTVGRHRIDRRPRSRRRCGARGGSPRSRPPARVGLLRHTSAPRSGRGPRQLLHRPLSAQLPREVLEGSASVQQARR